MLKCFFVMLIQLYFALFIISCSHSSGRNKSSYFEDEQVKEESSITIIGQPDTDIVNTFESDFTDDSISAVLRPASIYGVVEQILVRKTYLVSYNNETKCPNWVAWHLTGEHADGEIKRSGEYFEDMDVPEPRATNEDYLKSGWSKGHMCPAGDNKWDSISMRESNFFTNICPQHASLNSGLWNRIEIDCRRWARQYGDVYIVCGPVFLNCEHETIGVNKVFVPEAFFKVILCLQGKPKAIGFVVRNNEGKKKRDQFINTVDDVERITGMDFFPALPDSIEDVVEAYANLDDWR